jgi:TnpA family transposase
MARWQDRFLGLSQLPADLSDMELDEFFRFTPRDIRAIRETFRPQYRIPAAIQLGFVHMTGSRLNDFKVLPRNLLEFIGAQVEQPAPSIASLRTLYKRERTRFHHQVWAMERLGISAHSKRQERMLVACVREAAKGTSSIERLTDVARQWLFQHKLLIPADRTLNDICVRAAAHTEESIYIAIRKEVPEEKSTEWLDAVLAGHQDGRTVLEWLQEAPKRRQISNLNELFDKIEYLTELGVADLQLPGVPQDRMHTYALDLQHRRPARLRRLTDVTRTLELVCFLRVALTRTTDAVVHLSGKKAFDIMSQAKKQVVKTEALTLAEYRQVLRGIFNLADDPDLDAEALRARLRGIAHEFAPRAFPNRSAAVRAQVVEKTGAGRTLLRQLADLPIQAVEGQLGASGLKTLAELYTKERNALPKGKYDCAKVWKDLVDDPRDRERAMRALEMSTLLELRKGFRSGKCWVDSSESYRDRDHIFIPGETWERQRNRHYSLLRLPKDPKDYIEPLLKAAKLGLLRVAEAVKAGHLEINAGNFTLEKLEAEQLPPDVAATRSAIAAEIGPVQLPEILLHVDALTNFSAVARGGPASSEREQLLTYAAILGHGTEMNASGVALMIPGFQAEEVSAAMQALQYDDATGRAMRRLVDFIESLPVAQALGDGTTASSDMMSLPTSRHLWNSRQDPRRQTASIGMYTHVHDRGPIVYHQPIVLGERQSGAAIEGVVRQLHIDIERLAVDTHGYTDVAMGIARLLDFDLCPRLKNLRERRLTMPRGTEVQDVLATVTDCTLDLDCVYEQWDELVRVAASIHNGTTSAVLALERFGSAARGDPVHTAAKTLGRLIRTIYLCDYLTKKEFRRELHRILNRGESVHTLQRAIHFGEVPHARGRQKDELLTISGSLSLLTNVVIAWNAFKIQEAVNSLESRGHVFTPEILRHVSPVRYAHINFRGVFEFPMARYRSRLLGHLAVPGLRSA